jgi:hypothetical protein
MEANGVARKLAKKVLSLMDEQIHMEEGSHCILDIVIADFLCQWKDCATKLKPEKKKKKFILEL